MSNTFDEQKTCIQYDPNDPDVYTLCQNNMEIIIFVGNELFKREKNPNIQHISSLRICSLVFNKNDSVSPSKPYALLKNLILHIVEKYKLKLNTSITMEIDVIQRFIFLKELGFEVFDIYSYDGSTCLMTITLDKLLHNLKYIEKPGFQFKLDYGAKSSSS